MQTVSKLCRPWLVTQESALPAANLCHVFWALAVILLAFAGFTVIVVRLRRPASAAAESMRPRPAPTRAAD